MRTDTQDYEDTYIVLASTPQLEQVGSEIRLSQQFLFPTAYYCFTADLKSGSPINSSFLLLYYCFTADRYIAGVLASTPSIYIYI